MYASRGFEGLKIDSAITSSSFGGGGGRAEGRKLMIKELTPVTDLRFGGAFDFLLLLASSLIFPLTEIFFS